MQFEADIALGKIEFLERSVRYQKLSSRLRWLLKAGLVCCHVPRNGYGAAIRGANSSRTVRASRCPATLIKIFVHI